MPSDTVTDRTLVHADPLRATTRAIFEAIGFSAGHAELSAHVLVAADLRGVDTHGVSNMLRRYLDWAGSGHLNPKPRPRLLREGPSTAAFDSDAGLGIALLPTMMQTAIEKAGQTGVGMIALHNGRHSGMLAYHAMLALPHDMLGVCATAGGPRVLPTFGREPRLGTNPLAVAIPTAQDPPFVFDASTATVAHNKISTARRLGEPISAGWCAEPDGTPIMEDTPSSRELDSLILPLGATAEMGSHKGYALASIVEVLSSILSGGVFIAKLGPGFSNHFVAAIDVSGFTDPAGFKEEMTDFMDTLRATPPAAGRERVLVPNDREWETERQRCRDGIPLHPEVVGWFDETCRRYGIAPLARA
ncbi:MAG: Ldh family oxidoreductase [Nitriliruptorales bacterium]|nr:Ldh family oxidoreductase [Nitriliruptorales bacterium]